ncbi:MAG: DUF2203 family protein [Gemmatimonadales bacterium]
MAEIRIFSLEEAERTLPLVRRILVDLQAEYDSWRGAMADYELLAAGSRADLGETPELVAARESVTFAADRVNGLLMEVEEIGCVFKGIDEGLVDFYALRDDRLVFLCWRLGEERISHWHEVDSGFAGRQEIDPSLFSEVIP